MSLPDFTYLTPPSLKEAIRLMEERSPGEARIIGGGTDLVPAMGYGLSRPQLLLSLANVPELDGIDEDDHGALWIGASVRLRRLETSSLIAERFPILQQAARAVGSPQLREMGTIAGNVLLEPRCCFYNRSEFWRSCRAACLNAGGDVCNAVGSLTKCFAVFSGDLAPALIALRAEVAVVSSQGEHMIPLADMYTGDGLHPVSLGHSEIVRAIVIPPPTVGAVGVYLKRRLRNSIDFPLVSCALVRMPGDGGAQQARIVLGAVASRPVVVEGIEEILASTGIVSEDAAESLSIAEALASLAWKQAKPVENVLGVTASWRRQAVRELVTSAWAELDRQSDRAQKRRPQ